MIKVERDSMAPLQVVSVPGEHSVTLYLDEMTKIHGIDISIQ